MNDAESGVGLLHDRPVHAIGELLHLLAQLFVFLPLLIGQERLDFLCSGVPQFLEFGAPLTYWQGSIFPDDFYLLEFLFQYRLDPGLLLFCQLELSGQTLQPPLFDMPSPPLRLKRSNHPGLSH